LDLLGREFVDLSVGKVVIAAGGRLPYHAVLLAALCTGPTRLGMTAVVVFHESLLTFPRIRLDTEKPGRCGREGNENLPHQPD
jgi:hypothetical protein